MAIFKEAHQVRIALKMKLSNYAWYENSKIVLDGDDYHVIISVSKITNQIKQLIPKNINGVIVKIE